MTRKLTLTLCIILTTAALFGANKKTAAVMNFKGYGDKSIKFLDNALPESISTSLSEIKEIRIVERSQLGKVLNEIALEQTGAVDTGDLSRAGKLAKADILILGSISGTAENVIVTFKAVDVQSGTVLDSKTVKAALSQIFEKTSQAARAMGAIISGKGAGRISVFSTPDGADVYIDDIHSGSTPMVGYMVTTGEHSIKIVKSGYLEHSDSISVKAGSEDKVSVVLARGQVRDRKEIGFGIHFLNSTSPEISSAPLYTIFIGQTFDEILASIELGYSSPHHDLKIPHLGNIFTQERWYDLYFAHVSASYVPFPQWKYLLPYGGLSAGMIYAVDYRKNVSMKDDQELLFKQPLLSLGAKLGVNIIPYSNFSLFFEARYYYQPQAMTRYTYTSNGVAGNFSKHTDKIDFHFLSYGGGVKIFF